ncbi:MAG TPA: hypothetical protein EYQ00_05305 [Dehalococcoidia bacterium]|nr:hypothetical protein [Dehalococcoidia bacterium]
MIEAGAMIRIKGKIPDWLDKQKGYTFPDYDALVVEMKKPEDSMFFCTIMKVDGSCWNIYEKHIIGAVT